MTAGAKIISGQKIIAQEPVPTSVSHLVKLPQMRILSSEKAALYKNKLINYTNPSNEYKDFAQP